MSEHCGSLNSTLVRLSGSNKWESISYYIVAKIHTHYIPRQKSYQSLFSLINWIEIWTQRNSLECKWILVPNNLEYLTKQRGRTIFLNYMWTSTSIILCKANAFIYLCEVLSMSLGRSRHRWINFSGFIR